MMLKIVKNACVILLAFLILGCGAPNKNLVERMDSIENDSLQRDYFLAKKLGELVEHFNSIAESYNKHLEEYHGYKQSVGYY